MHTGRQIDGASLIVCDLRRTRAAGHPSSLTRSTGYNDPVQCKGKAFVSFIKHLSHTTDSKVQRHGFLEYHDNSVGLSTLFLGVAPFNTIRRILYVELHTHPIITDGPAAISVEAALFEFPCNVQSSSIVITECFVNPFPLLLSSQVNWLDDGWRVES